MDRVHHASSIKRMIIFHSKTRTSFSFRNAQLMEDTSEFSVIDQPVTAGACMKTPENQFLVAALKINSRNAIHTFR